MKRKIIMLAIIGCFFGAAGHAQETQKNKPDNDAVANQPGGSWKVNKKFDDKGNLIGYDSTYSWSYSSHDSLGQRPDIDSFFNNFGFHFDGDDLLKRWGFTFPGDSTFNRSFIDPGRMLEDMERNFSDMWKQMDQMPNMIKPGDADQYREEPYKKL